uniref:Uncharacterized protein n=1 Tax=Sulfolobus islandicus rod-shaped virus 1 TaxID=157898 RepID=Q5W362_SIRV1|nr:hypothetical protein [Sulfolobus islandicus rod-shaped virus 1]
MIKNMRLQDFLNEVFELAEKYTRNSGEKKNIFKRIRRKMIEKKIIEGIEKYYYTFYLYLYHGLDLTKNEIEFTFEDEYENKFEKIKIIVKAYFKVKIEDNEFKLINVKFEKSVKSIS